MRTKVQLDNIKRALFPGPFGLMLSDEDVEAFANRIQERVDEIEYTWDVRIRLVGDKRPWESIRKEEVAPVSTLGKIEKSYGALLARYPKIEEVQIAEAELKADVYVIKRLK